MTIPQTVHLANRYNIMDYDRQAQDIRPYLIWDVVMPNEFQVTIWPIIQLVGQHVH